MKNDGLTKQQSDAVLQALDNALDQGPWEESNFLRVIGKNLRNIRDDFVTQIESAGKEQASVTVQLANQKALRRDQQKVYLQLYTSDGKNMQSWEWIIANLPRQMISRPIYAEEADVKAIIKTKDNTINEAYVAIYVGQNDMLQISADKIPVDKLGKSRLSLKDGSIKLENIDCFTHQGETYHYYQGRLVKDNIKE